MFYRSARHPFGRAVSRRSARALVIALYILYPLGCVLRLRPFSDAFGGAADIAGLLLIAAALLVFAVLAGSSLQRQAQEPEDKLDERESAERNRAAYWSYSAFAGLVVAGATYMMIATDLVESGKATLWTPQTGDHWNAVVGGLVLLGMTLPAAVLAWGKETADME
ncbi:MAG: hypothetical protein GC206_05050 [Alphaproteobacteria bacterium]|nr:hypothetical protein [Alphaproteobacteria bacterium]